MDTPCCEADSNTPGPGQEPVITLNQVGDFNLEARSLILDFLNRFPNQSCEYNFVNLFCWKDIYRYSWYVYKERLVIYDGLNQVIFMPLGKPMLPASLHALSKRFADIGHSANICLASKDYLETYPEFEQFYSAEPDRDAAEYIYLTKSLVDLKGTKLHKKRNLIAQFKRKYPDYRVLPITLDNCQKVAGFARDLLMTLDPVPKSLADEYVAIEAAFSNWEALGLEGLVLMVADKIAAFSVFSPLTDDTWNIHFEKSNMAFKGAAQVINWETASVLADRAKYLNREQDLGIKGLRQAKLSYEPDHLLIPYTFTFKPHPRSDS